MGVWHSHHLCVLWHQSLRDSPRESIDIRFKVHEKESRATNRGYSKMIHFISGYSGDYMYCCCLKMRISLEFQRQTLVTAVVYGTYAYPSDLKLFELWIDRQVDQPFKRLDVVTTQDYHSGAD